MKRSTGITEETPPHTSEWVAKGPPPMAHDPAAMTTFGSGTASHVFRRASRMLAVTGPVTRIPSPCRGDAMN